MDKTIVITIRASDRGLYEKFKEELLSGQRPMSSLIPAYLHPTCFFFPRKVGDLCAFCKDPIDLDKVNEVGPEGTEWEGKDIHRRCQYTILINVRNDELRAKRESENE